MTIVTVLITSMGISKNFIYKYEVDIKIKEKSKKEMKNCDNCHSNTEPP